MNTGAKKRQKLIEAVNALPDNTLLELASFIDYLHYKSTQQPESDNHKSSFLMSIAGLGTSNETNISERDEEILKTKLT
ncbi:hypothetical protein [Nodularia sp. UHCC 0506]|uniref:hypothetical protein n=1 Tax=Nodularia sp. UHCC 0506 TaxID=3110243 RepID=UPI002B220638|nr:hypothetical protein [Nodularia sp. UHCC 0506]MEA5514227.1 hypothetical protein [Nodularia sp. UHCC 0506]